MNDQKKAQLALLDAYLLLIDSDHHMLLCSKKPKNWSNRVTFIQALIDELLFELADVPLVRKPPKKTLPRKLKYAQAKPSQIKKSLIARR